MRVLIIGSTGYVGSRLVQYLAGVKDANGEDAFEVVTQWESQSLANPDYRELTREFVLSFDAVILLAALSNPARCKKPWPMVYDQNVARFQELIEKMGCRQKFIYASSSSVYGEFSGPRGATELDALIKPENHYDASKMLIDIMAQRSGLQYYGLRFGTVSGPAPIMREDVIVNAMARSAYYYMEIKAINPLVRRPILCITDLCRAIETILFGGNKSGIYNLASFNTTVGEIARVTKAVFDEAMLLHPITIVEDVSEVMYDFTIDCTKFRQAFNFNFNGALRNLTQELLEHYRKTAFTSGQNNVRPC